MLISSMSFSSQIYKTVSGSDITGIKVFSDIHANPDIQNYALVYTTLIPGCPRGLYFDPTKNTAIYSSILAAKMSGHDQIALVVEDSLFTPWGDKDFCGLTSFQLIY